MDDYRITGTQMPEEEAAVTVFFEEEGDMSLPLPCEELAVRVAGAALDFVGCPYQAQVNLLLTMNDQIREMNREFRGIDRATDVLSFPMIEYEKPSDFSKLEDSTLDNFNPETGELILGDIIISVPKIVEQAEKYGHSTEREFAFLVVHSMLHLFGYDHMEANDAKIMEAKQEEILNKLEIFR